MDYLKYLVEEIHSTTVATIGADGHPQTRVIDMMYYDEEGVYFLTANGKAFYDQLIEQRYIALSATKDKTAISLRGNVKNIGKKNLEIMFERNPYMKEIYPGDTRLALEVFCIYEARGEYFDISNPSKIIREEIVIGEIAGMQSGYCIGDECDGCGACLAVCPQRCIETNSVPAKIIQKHCLHCGNCFNVCPVKAVGRREI